MKRRVLRIEIDRGARRRRSRRAYWLVAAGAMLVASLSVLSTFALFTSSGAVTGNLIAVKDCFQAQVESVQSGQLTSTSAGTHVVSIGAVDTGSAFLLFSIRSDSNRPPDSTVRGRLASSTSLEFVRVTDAVSPPDIIIEWSVVEYACGVSVQRGEVIPSAVTTDVAITPVSLAQTFVTASKTVADDDESIGDNDPFTAYLTAAANLRIEQDATGAAHVISWQVIEFENPDDALVQRGQASLTGSSLSVTDVLPTAVDLSQAFVMATYRTNGSGADLGARLIRAELTDSTSVTFERDVVGDADDITDIRYEVIELKDGSTVQSGVAVLAPGIGTIDTSISPVDVATSTATATVSGFAGQSLGSTDYVADDVVGVASTTITLLDSTTVRVQRSNTSGTARVSWSVIDWGGPSWWDTAYVLRRRFDITTGSGSPPPGQTIDVRVSGDDDDAEENLSGIMDLTSSDLELIQEGSRQIVGLRFPAVGIPQGATITTAWIQFTADETSGGVVNLDIAAETSDSAPVISASVNDLSNRTRTSATVSWSPPDWTIVGEAGSAQQTPDLATVVTEVVNRPAWTTSSAILLLISGTDITKRVADSYDGSPTEAPLLHIEYLIIESVESGFTVPFVVDHADLVTDGLALLNGDDMRVAYWNGATWTELDRAIDPVSAWNLVDTKVWFPLAASIPAETTISSYWLYFTNPSAGTPPANVDDPTTSNITVTVSLSTVVDRQ